MADFKIINELKNSLFNRTEIELVAQLKNTPVRAEVEKFLSEKYSSPIEGIYVDTIKGKFGSDEFNIIARIYPSKEDKDLTELKTQKQRKAETEATAKPAEVAPAEAPKEEVKEAPKEEAKTE